MDLFLNRMHLDRDKPAFTYHNVMRIDLEHIDTVTSATDLSKIPYHMLHSFMFSIIDKPTLPAIKLPSCDGAHTIENEYVHPMDVFIYIFMKCDTLFRQIFVNQLSKCQISLPLIISHTEIGKPIIFSFAYRSLIKSYYCANKLDIIDFHVCDAELHVISFIRIGNRQNNEKSKFLNKILGYSQQIFFEESDEGSSAERLLFNGTIEVNWYLPDEIDSEDALHSKPLTILNLRGNGFDYPELLKFLFSVSAMVGIMLTYSEIESNELEGLRKLASDFGGNICLIIEGQNVTAIKESFGKLEDPNNCIIHVADRFEKLEKLVSKSIQKFISKNKSKNMPLNNFSKLAKTIEINIITEEELHGKIEEYDRCLNQFKENILDKISNNTFWQNSIPLQVKWVKIAELDKAKHRHSNIGKKTAEYFEKLSKLKIHKTSQIEALYNHFTRSVIGNMTNLFVEGHQDASYMLSLLRIELEKLSLYTEPQDTDMDNEQGSVGIRHFTRELAQYYEMNQSAIDFNPRLEFSNSRSNIQYQNLPALFAELLLLGYPFELLDGNAHHIPFDWVNDVLNRLAVTIGSDKKLFVLGVLGIQSSGKSTLLNTMFGLQFPVSAGRCTRGVSMQLIPMEEQSMARNLHYDYMVVVDSEGLRSLDFSDDVRIARDNELATFVVGISDLTLVNIQGENSADWEDIFQIIILALTKLSFCSSKVKCFFIHQQVKPTATAKRKLSQSYKKFLSRLDTATNDISSEIKNKAKYAKFTDIVDFDIDHSTFLFSSLYSYSLVRSEISHYYRHSAIDLMNRIVRSHSGEATPYHFSTLADWNKKIENVWTCILKENFVFSYKNIRERICYTEIETVLQDWSQELFCEVERIWLKIRDSILTVESINVEQTKAECQAQLTVACNETLKDKENEIKEKYFVNHKDVKIFELWQNRASAHFANARWNYKTKMNKELVEILQQAQQNKLAEYNNKRNKIIKRATEAELEKTLESFEKNKKSQDFVESFFETKWKTWITGIDFFVEDYSEFNDFKDAIQTTTVHTTSAEKEIIQSYFELLSKNKVACDKFIICSDHYKKVLRCNIRLRATSNYGDVAGNEFSCWINLIQQVNTESFDDKKWHLKNQFIQKVDKLREEICKDCQDYIRDAISREYTPEVYTVIIGIISNNVQIFNNRKDKLKIDITDVFIYELSLFICTGVMNQFLAKKQRTDQLQMCTLKQQLKNNFTVSYNSEHYSVSIACANGLAAILQEKMNFYLSENFQLLMLQHFSASHEYSLSSKCQLQTNILTDLARLDSFEKYLEYIKQPNKILKEEIEKKIRQFCRNHSMLEDFKEGVKSCADTYCRVLRWALITDDECNDKLEETISYKINPNWKIKLHTLLEGEHTRQFKLSDLDVILIQPRMINNPDDFVHFFAEAFNYKTDSIDFNDWYKQYIMDNISSEITCANIFYCDAVCPFCNEPCLSSDNSADHMHTCGSFHRPLCVNGWFRSDTNKFIGYDCSNIPNDTEFVLNNILKYEDCALAGEKWDNCSKHYMIESVYWERVMYKFRNEFISHYGYLANERVLDSWSSLSDGQVLKLLQKQIDDYNRPASFWRFKKKIMYYLNLKPFTYH